MQYKQEKNVRIEKQIKREIEKEMKEQGEEKMQDCSTTVSLHRDIMTERKAEEKEEIRIQYHNQTENDVCEMSMI